MLVIALVIQLVALMLILLLVILVVMVSMIVRVVRRRRRGVRSRPGARVKVIVGIRVLRVVGSLGVLSDSIL